MRWSPERRGTGKSVTLRILREHFSHIREMRVGVLTRPQCNVPDLYREIGDLLGVGLSPQNRRAGTKVLRERWRVFAEAALFRPVPGQEHALPGMVEWIR